MRWVAITLLFAAAPLAAQVAAPGDDARFQTIDYDGGGIFHVQTAADTVQTVLFARGEQIRSVIVSDPNAYQITVAGSGDSLTLKAAGPMSLAMVNVRTDQRSYDLELVAGKPGELVPSIVRFSYGERRAPAPPIAGDAIRKSPDITWRITGSKALRPLEITDDGDRTYIAWGKGQAMPAVFAVGVGDSEQMVDGYVRNGRFTIDRVHERLVFRIDKESASARRIRKKGRHDRPADNDAG